MKKNSPWWRGGVIYQIYPRSFKDSNGDGIGDLKGITAQLDYVASLGVDGVWISPFFKSPMADFGYDVSDYQDIDPLFGNLQDCDALIAEMHKRGLKLIVDLVLNHTSEKHPWFAESRKSRDNPKADWYVWADPKADGTPPNNWMSVFGGSAWQYDTRRGQYYWHQFLKEQPDLNVRNPEVQNELIRIMRWWLDRGVDGFRLDALNHCMHDALLRDNPPLDGFDRSQPSGRQTHPYYWQRHLYDKTQPEMIPFLEKLRALCDEYPDRMMVAEIGDDFQVKTSVEYTNGPKRLHTAYSFALMSREIYTAKGLRGVVEEYINTPGDSWPSWAFSNHDVVRVASRWSKNGAADPRQAKMLIALLTTLRGTAFMYQGEELGLAEADVPFEKLQDPFGKFLWPEDKGRDGCRTPMPWDDGKKHAGFSDGAEPWLPVSDLQTPFSVMASEQNADSVLHFARHFIKWRKNHPAIIGGDLAFVDMPEPVIAFTRSSDGAEIFCAYNLSDQPMTVTMPRAYKALEGSRLTGAAEGTSLKLKAYEGFVGS
ncbi:MAG: alpha-glucosidase [Bdellovibrionales bacterium]